MPNAFVDTTILVDALLNIGLTRESARNALGRYEQTDAPVYALKELSSGALQNFRWFHNKLALNSFADAIAALQRMSLSPRRYTTATAIQAIQVACQSMINETPNTLAKKYGKDAEVNQILKDRWRLAVKKTVFQAWKNRRRLTTTISIPCSCYAEGDLVEGPHGTIEMDKIGCRTQQECSMATALKSRPGDLRKLRDAILRQPAKRENIRRAQVLRELYRLPKQPMTKDMCRSMGDAIFAFFAPSSSVVLTTNIADHQPLVEALGKMVEHP